MRHFPPDRPQVSRKEKHRSAPPTADPVMSPHHDDDRALIKNVRLNRILSFRLVLEDPEALRRFYVRALGFWAAELVKIPDPEIEALGIGVGGYRTTLSLLDQHLELDWFAAAGRPYPQDCDAADLGFQHCAILVTDAADAYRRALAYGATAISTTGPVQLPASSGNVIAVKFRDPEGHPLEFLQLPLGVAPHWEKRARANIGALGIDHSAISVANTEASIPFYEACGLRQGQRTLNQGATQAALDGLDMPCVDVTPLLPERDTPHLELLGYRGIRRSPQPQKSLIDIAATRVVWAADRDGVLYDPDGHAHQLMRDL